MTVKRLLAGLALLLSMPSTAQPPAELPAWLVGAWTETRGDAWAEEYWTPPRGGIMMGAGRNGRGETLKGWETIRIMASGPDAPVFVASAQGGTPVTFALEAVSANSISFVNSGHDYPQRIRYWREGDTMLAELSLIDGSERKQWRYRPIGG